MCIRDRGSGKRYPFVHPVENKNEGLKTSSQVNYVARCGNFRSRGFAYTGALKILQVILSYDYLWLNLRVKGGAYGCMSGFGRSGEGLSLIHISIYTSIRFWKSLSLQLATGYTVLSG